MKNLKRYDIRAFTLVEALMASAVLCAALGMAIYFLGASSGGREEFAAEFEKQSVRFLSGLKKDLRSASKVSTKANSIKIEMTRPAGDVVETAVIGYETADLSIKRSDAAGIKVLMDLSRTAPAGYSIYFEISPSGDRNYDYILRALGPGNKKIFEKRESVSSGL